MITAERILWGAVLITAIVVAWQARGWAAPEPVAPAPDTVRVDRPITVTDTVTETEPRTVRVYDTVRATERIYVSVPTDWSPQGLISKDAVDISSDEATLTYYDPNARRYKQSVYDLPDYAHRVSAVAEAHVLPATAGVLVGGQYARRWSDVPLFSSLTAEWTGGYAVTTRDRGPAGRVSLSADITW
jgi:hypothetical protein